MLEGSKYRGMPFSWLSDARCRIKIVRQLTHTSCAVHTVFYTCVCCFVFFCSRKRARAHCQRSRKITSSWAPSTLIGPLSTDARLRVGRWSVLCVLWYLCLMRFRFLFGFVTFRSGRQQLWPTCPSVFVLSQIVMSGLNTSVSIGQEAQNDLCLHDFMHERNANVTQL